MKKPIGVILAVVMAAATLFGSLQTAFAAPVEDQMQATAVNVGAQAQDAVADGEDYPKVNLLENREEGVKIGYTKYPGAVKYRVFFKSGNTWKGLGNSTCLSFVHKISNSYTTYTYTVRAIGADGNFISAYNKEGYTHQFVYTPVIQKIENVDGGAELSWNAKSGVVYRVFYKDETNKWRKLAKTTNNSYIHKNLKNGADWTYTLRYENNQGQFVSAYNTNGWKNKYVAPPTIKSITRDNTVFNINWNNNPYAERYRVYRKQGSDSWVTLGDTTADSYTDKKLVSGVKYTYIVRALNSKATRYTSAMSKSKWKIAVTASNMPESHRKLREEMIAFLGQQVGNNNRRYIDHVNRRGNFGLGYGTQWCAVFGWGATDIFCENNSKYTYLIPPRWHVSDIANEARKYGGWHNTFSTTYEAKPGDIFMTSFQKYPYSDGRTHVGYIEYVDKDKNGKVTYIHTVEGNFNWEVGDNSKTVVGRSRWKDRLVKDHGAMVTDYIDLEKIVKIN